jgi:hypothetical protein
MLVLEIGIWLLRVDYNSLSRKAHTVVCAGRARNAIRPTDGTEMTILCLEIGAP